MSAILKYKDKDGKGSIGQGIMPGGGMSAPDIKGFVKLDDDKRFLAVKDGVLCYYNSDNVSLSVPPILF